MSVGWLQWLLAAAMVAVAGYHVARLVETRVRHEPASIDVEITHAAMGAAMTAMLIGVVAPSDNRWLAVPFLAAGAWFAGRGVHAYVMDGVTPRAVTAAWQVVGCAAMTYMSVAVLVQPVADSSMAGMTMDRGGRVTAAWPALRIVLLLATVAWAVAPLAGRRLSRPPTGRSGRSGLSAGCQLAMNVTTVYMLMAM